MDVDLDESYHGDLMVKNQNDLSDYNRIQEQTSDDGDEIKYHTFTNKESFDDEYKDFDEEVDEEELAVADDNEEDTDGDSSQEYDLRRQLTILEERCQELMLKNEKLVKSNIELDQKCRELDFKLAETNQPMLESLVAELQAKCEEQRETIEKLSKKLSEFETFNSERPSSKTISTTTATVTTTTNTNTPIAFDIDEEEENSNLYTPSKRYPRQSIGQWSMERQKRNLSVKSLVSSLESQRVTAGSKKV